MDSNDLLSGWRRLTLNDLGRIVTGKTPSTKVAEYFSGDIPFVTPSDMNGLKIISKTERYLTPLGSDSVRGAKLPAGSVMVSCIGSDMGKVAIAGKDCVTNQQLNSIIVDEKFYPEFVYYNLSSRKEELQRLAGSGSALPILNKGHFSQLEIEIPIDKNEQRSIARVLGALDDKIELNRQMNHTLEAIAQALFKSWFVDFDPVTAKAAGRAPFGMNAETAALFPSRFEESDLSAIPESWRTGKIKDIGKNIKVGVRPNDVDSETAYIGLEHIPRKSIALSDWGNAGDVTSQKFQFSKGDILFGKLRPYFHKVGVAPVSGVCSTDILVLNSISSEWFGLLLGHISSVEFINYVDGASGGTRMPRTDWETMSKYEIVIPEKTISQKYSEQVSNLVSKIHANIEESNTLAALRDLLLPKFLSGEMRVRQAEKLVAEVF
jgi:type I restriction enzyme S subunit